MRVLLPCLVAVAMTTDAFAQTPAPPAQPPAQTPAQPPATPPATPEKKPAARRQQPAQSMVPTTVTVTITDASGAPLDNVHVSATGPVSRQTLSIDTGVARLNSVKPGDYRLRFEREGFITLERDLTVKGGSPATIDVSLSPAPPPPPAPEPTAVGRVERAAREGAVVSTCRFSSRRHFIRGGETQKEDEIGCTASRVEVRRRRCRCAEHHSRKMRGPIADETWPSSCAASCRASRERCGRYRRRAGGTVPREVVGRSDGSTRV